jgi:hypothetical protein
VDAYQAMAEFVNLKTNANKANADWDWKAAKDRWTYMFNTYKTTKKKVDHQTGWGVDFNYSDANTVAAQCELKCPMYSRIDELFGTRQVLKEPLHADHSHRTCDRHLCLIRLSCSSIVTRTTRTLT